MIHLYCGNGKGKTTASVGLALRWAGTGRKVYFFQFLKNGNSSEISILKNISGIILKSCTPCNKFTFRMNDDEKKEVCRFHNEMLNEISDIIRNESDIMIVLDEFIGAYNKGMFDKELAENIIDMVNEKSEVILTGREPSDYFIGKADYVSEIKEIKHPYQKGITARYGIEY